MKNISPYRTSCNYLRLFLGIHVQFLAMYSSYVCSCSGKVLFSLQCNVFVEETEEVLEEWWRDFDRDNENLENWLCIEKALGKSDQGYSYANQAFPEIESWDSG